MKKFDVVALGELLIDFTENGISEQGNPMLEANPGGAPCNVLSMLQELNRSTAFIGKVGNDNFGRMLMEVVSGQGIDVSGLAFDNEVHTTLAFVHTAPDGDRSFSFYRDPGADVMLTENDVPEEIIAGSKLFHFGTLSMTHEASGNATKKALRIAHENGLMVSFDPNLRPPLWKNLDDARKAMAYGFEHCDILKISDDEILFFTGEEDIAAGVEKIKKEYDIKLILATMGKDGSMAFYKDMRIAEQSFISDKTIETTGAGDTFMGIALHNVLEKGLEAMKEDDLRELLKMANAGASIITERRGALKVMPKRQEVMERMLSR
ncbi:MAG: carbohydrate kinase [Lachnospiraceae bacterium]|nr:carbohydrate kinase [Lachnospiraceae bacterium]